VSKKVRPTGTVIEREAKLVAPAGVRLPDMTGLVPGATAIELPELRLDATYYDTDDLRLARSGITLRWRGGEPGPPWTVKIPHDAGGPVLDRHEIRFDGRVDEVPSPATDLVLASARTQGIRPVARLTTIRRPIEIRDGGGRLLAYVVDDTVFVTSERCPGGRFREVEIELHDPGDSGRRILDSAALRLVAAGCVAESPVPKLVRALGEPATRAPDVVVATLTADASVVDVLRHAVARSVAQVLRHDPGVRLGGDPENVHQLRVGARRLRSDLRSFTPLLERDRVAQLRAELGWLGTVVGDVRDHDVLATRLVAHIATLPGADAHGGAQLQRRLEDEADEARSVMLEAMRGARYVELLEALVGLASVLPLREMPGLTDRSNAQLESKIARKPWRRLASAVDALGPDPSDAELHQIRILAKRCRYAAEAVAPVVGPAASRFAEAVEEVQTVLGDHHDAVVAESWLRHAAADVPSCGLAAGQLVALERSLRLELRAQWRKSWRAASAKKLRHWI
jgi:CHAD domain-containing protein